MSEMENVLKNVEKQIIKKEVSRVVEKAKEEVSKIIGEVKEETKKEEKEEIPKIIEKKEKVKKKVSIKKKNPNNIMKNISIGKVTVNICVGNDKLKMDKAELLLKKLTNKTPVKACAKRRLATWQIRPGLPIGFKVTLRKNDAIEFLKWIFQSKNNKIKEKSIDKYGNFGIGFSEYLELVKIKYDADIGIMGFELMTTFIKPGNRIKDRRIKKSRIPNRHKPTKEETIVYLKEKFNVEVTEK